MPGTDSVIDEYCENNMRSAISKYFNDSFDLSHAAFISIAVHFLFFATQPFGIFDKPLVQEEKYKKIDWK